MPQPATGPGSRTEGAHSLPASPHRGAESAPEGAGGGEGRVMATLGRGDSCGEAALLVCAEVVSQGGCAVRLV